MPQDAPPCREGGHGAHRSPFTTKLEVANGPFHLPSMARTVQVYLPPALTFISGAHRVSFSPAATVPVSLSPDADDSSKTYLASGCPRSAMLRTTRVTLPEGTWSPSAGVRGAGSSRRLR